MPKELLKMEGITKIYPNGFMANKDVTFSVNEGEIHALIGENGAGKTTLMKILFGHENCQEGKIYINGEETKIANPLDAIAKGVGIGTSAHAVGTSKALQMGEVEGAMSGLSIAVAGVLTAVLCPIFVGFIQ